MDFVRVKTLNKNKPRSSESMFIVTHKVGLSVAAEPSYDAIKVNVHEGKEKRGKDKALIKQGITPMSIK